MRMMHDDAVDGFHMTYVLRTGDSGSVARYIRYPYTGMSTDTVRPPLPVVNCCKVSVAPRYLSLPCGPNEIQASRGPIRMGLLL